MASIHIALKGIDELIALLESNRLLSKPLRDFFTRSVIIVQGRARVNASEMAADTGHLAGSLFYEVDTTEIPLWGLVGTNVAYAPFVEFGTGSQGDPEAPYAHQAGHYPPPGALADWARRHGLNPFAVARAIAKRGGLKARPFLRDAFDASEADIERELEAAGEAMRALWDQVRG